MTYHSTLQPIVELPAIYWLYSFRPAGEGQFALRTRLIAAMTSEQAEAQVRAGLPLADGGTRTFLVTDAYRATMLDPSVLAVPPRYTDEAFAGSPPCWNPAPRRAPGQGRPRKCAASSA